MARIYHYTTSIRWTGNTGQGTSSYPAYERAYEIHIQGEPPIQDTLGLKITRDLTERRKIEALQLADRQKDKFLATLSHELRRHLNASLGWVSLMRESPKDETTGSARRTLR